MQLFATESGEIDAFLFENNKTGLARDLFWSITVDLKPIALFDESWECSFQCEWMTWPVRTIDDLDGVGLTQLRQPDLVEATMYVDALHQWVTVSQLAVRRAVGAGYQADIAGEYELEANGRRQSGQFQLQCDLVFEGIIVVPENLTPRPSNPKEVAEVVAPFISLAGFKEPRLDGFRYLLRPLSN